MPNGILALVGAVWVAIIAAGFSALLLYKETPGAPAQAGPTWPKESALSLAPDKTTLVLLSHPMCPCTKASIEELARIMARVGDRVQATVLLNMPDGAPAEWRTSELVEKAARIPGVTVRFDDGGKQTAMFGAFTSGQTLLYAPSGELLFAGGITPSRGHEGDNVGSVRILSLVEHGSADARTSPVYGCNINKKTEAVQ